MPHRKAKSTHKLTVERLSIPDVLLIKPKPFRDQRGTVAELWSDRDAAEAQLHLSFVQENLSYSKKIGTMRGLHCQKQPQAQGKLVTVLSGQIFDIALDIRTDSSTYGKYVDVKLSADDPTWLYVPPGFLHGFCTLTNDVTVIYKMTDYYVPEAEAGIRWNDPDLGIPWPFDAKDVVISDKDKALPLLKDLPELFTVNDVKAETI